MREKIKTVAFDLGGVLTYQDFSCLSEEEKFLWNIHMNRNNISDKKLVDYAQSRIEEIYIKLNKLRNGSREVLEFLLDERIKVSIWTNNIAPLDVWLEENGIYKYVTKLNVINSFYLGVDKPKLEFYRKALTILKDNPKEVMFLDDNFENVRSSLECGIQGIQYEKTEEIIDVVQAGLRKGR